MKIDVIANDGSPLGVTEKSIFGEDGRMGVGGAELAILTLCKGWTEAGHKVTFYNSPDDPKGSCFAQKGIDEFAPFNARDILIVFRSPNMRIRDGANGLKVWFSTDQSTVGNFKQFAGMVDKIVTISPFHSQHFQNAYGIANTIAIDLPVRTWEYDLDTPKMPLKCIFNSIPDRGAIQLADVWRKITAKLPDAQLTITSDWRLWDKKVPPHIIVPYREAFNNLPNVQYLGAINRRELIKHELESQIHLNVNIYDELFCISIAETQVAGAYPVSSTTGAIRTTNMGMAIEGRPYDNDWKERCANAVVDLFENPRQLLRLQNKTQHQALHRFSLPVILKQWDEQVFNG